MYEKSSAMNKMHLMRRLFNLQMSKGGFVVDHISEFNMIVSQLSLVEINFDDEIKALILMSYLPECGILLLSQSAVPEDLINRSLMKFKM